MNKPNQVLSIASVLLLTFVITACQKQAVAPASPSEVAPSVSTNTENTQVDNTTSNDTESSNNGAENSTVERDSTQSFDMGMGDKRTATLKQSDGYSLYVFDEYTLDTATNRLQRTANPKYYAEIEKLASDFKLDELRNQGTKELTQYGEVKEYKGDQLYESPMARASLLLQVSNEKGLYDYIVWEDESTQTSYIFHVHVPEGEASETFLTPALTSLSSIVSDGES